MKRILTLALLCLAMAFTAMAQSMKVYQDGQLKAVYYFNQSDSLVFSDDFPFPPGDENENDPVSPTPGKPVVSYSHAVDLGLPSGTKWADMNVGAEKPEDYGWYLAWGETEEKDVYSWSTYKWCNGSYNTQTKYCTSSSYGTVDNKTTLDPEDDAAHVNWGGDWRMPTRAEQVELYSECTWTWTTLNGVYGRKVTGPNGNSIFLPASGYRDASSLGDAGSYGSYWSSSLGSGFSRLAFDLSFDSSYVDWIDNYRPCGRSVRAVCP